MYHIIHRFERVSPETVSRALESGVGTASIHEAAGKIGAMSSRIKPIYSGMRVCGPAFTVKCPPGDNLILHGALASAKPGDVLVVDNDGHEGGPFGENMSVAAQTRKIAGLVINGHVRDGLGIKALGWPVFALGLSMKGTVMESLGTVNHPISCGGVVVKPGDFVLGDDDGVVVIPREQASDVVDKAIAREKAESARRDVYRTGKTGWEVSSLGEIAVKKGLRQEPI